MAWRLISTRVGAALLLPQRAFVPAVVALQVAESHVRGRAGLQPGVVVRLNGHERLQDLVELEVNLVSRELPRAEVGVDGNIYFENPTPAMTSSFCYKGLCEREQIVPSNGLLAFFPGWLMHGITTNQTNHDRMSLSFNIVFDRNESNY